MTSTLLKQISTQLEDLQQEGFFKTEHVLSSPPAGLSKNPGESGIIEFLRQQLPRTFEPSPTRQGSV